MTIEYTFRQVSGLAADACHILASRGEPAQPSAREDLVIESVGDTLHAVALGSYFDLWRAPSGACFVVGGDEVLLGGPGQEWASRAFPFSPTRRVFGTADAVYLTGDADHVHRWHGGDWRAEPVPHPVTHLDGGWAALGVGGIARRADGAWQVSQSFGAASARWIHADPDGALAAVGEGVYRLDGGGWAPWLRGLGGVVHAVTRWRDAVWLSVAGRGLCVVRDQAVVDLKPNLTPSRLDARGELLLTQTEMAVTSADGASFGAWTQAHLEELFVDPPYWI